MFRLKKGKPNVYKVFLENGDLYKDPDGDHVDIHLVKENENSYIVLDEDGIPYIAIFRDKKNEWHAYVSTRAKSVYADGKSRMKALENALNKLPYWHAGRYEWGVKGWYWRYKKAEKQLQRAWELSSNEFGVK